MKSRAIALTLTVGLLLVVLTACGSPSNTLSGTYYLDNSGILGGIASAAGAMNSLSFSGGSVTVDVGGGVTWSGTYTLDGTTLTISPGDGGTGLSGTVSSDKKTITVATLKYVKE